jgi:hypothetical protein
LPTPPASVSISPLLPPLRMLAATLPVMTLLPSLPVPLRAAAPRSVSRSCCAPRTKVIALSTVSMPSSAPGSMLSPTVSIR